MRGLIISFTCIGRLNGVSFYFFHQEKKSSGDKMSYSIFLWRGRYYTIFNAIHATHGQSLTESWQLR